MPHGPFPPALTGDHLLDVPSFPYSPDKAKALLQQAGWSVQGGVWTKGDQTLSFDIAAYGRPWSAAQRRQLFTWIRSWGMTAYLYAPKDELKHRALWRAPYTEGEADQGEDRR